MALLAAVLSALGDTAGAADPAVFSPAEIIEWEPHAFDGQTRYTLERKAGRKAVYARCDDGASGLFLRRSIDLLETPVIEWSWLVPRPPDGPPEIAKDGDDFAARLYLVDEHPWLPWRTRAINYVWSASRPVGSDWPNPFAAQAHMVVVATGGGGSGWTTQRRNLRDDFRRYHDIEVERIDALAIMTDCDNTGLARQAWYGSIRLLAE